MSINNSTTNPQISAAASALYPVTFRLPKSGSTDLWFGGTRSFWNEHCLPTEKNGHRPPVKSIVRRQPGAKRGIRFVVFASAKAYFDRLAAEQSPDETADDSDLANN